MKEIKDMTLEEVEKEIEQIVPEESQTLFHVKKFLTDSPESNGFIHAEILRDRDEYFAGLKGSFTLADCSRMIHLELVPEWYSSSTFESYIKEYNEKIAKLNLLIDTLTQMKDIIEATHESEKRLFELIDARRKLKKDKDSE